jgi:hypothetical protein
METVSASDLQTIAKEVVSYIKSYGTPTQKKKLKTY